ncbi:endolytic transglycosylase MltG [Flavobacterium sp.]|uniref:endolytic transglycosylase MltG n=1 Tax=Flavobacterium sp. TaxID=239 RepID=UPI0037C13F6A
MEAKKLFIRIISIGAAIIIISGGYIINKAFTGNTKFEVEEVYVYVPTDSKYEDIKKILAPYIENQSKIDWVASKRDYNSNVKAGKFLLKKGMSSFSIVRALRLNIPVKLAFNNQEKVQDLFVRIASQIEPDTTKLNEIFTNDTFLKENGLNKDNIMSFFIPNSYEFYWNTSPEELSEKLTKEYKRFWNDGRLAKAKALNLSPAQVYTLASIVHKETAKADERPKVAGVYLNRLNKNMPLQADPTVIFALKQKSNDWNLVVKRVMHNDLIVNSPYNTYKNEGLPPGPIFMPDVSAIDAVLNPEKHNYLYFCASVERFGYHEFATDFSAHLKVAAKYAEWVKKQNYKR